MLLFAGMINELIAQKDELAPDLLYDQLVERTGYLRMLEEKHTVEDDARAQNIKELKSSIINYKGETDNPTLEGYLADVALYTDMDNYDENADCVVMMTMHSAKGLEFPNVFVVGCEEGIFPGIKAIGEADEMEEERRLCYVAITRAKSACSFPARGRECSLAAQRQTAFLALSTRSPRSILKSATSPEATDIRKIAGAEGVCLPRSVAARLQKACCAAVRA